MGKFIDLTGQKFGRLTVVSATKKRDCTGSVVFECLCVCGNIAYITSRSLRSAKTISCGCACNKYRPDVPLMTGFEGTASVNYLKRQEPNKNNTSGQTGVCLSSRDNKYCAYITFKRKTYQLGRFENKQDAIHGRKEGENRIHGEFIEWWDATYGKKV